MQITEDNAAAAAPADKISGAARERRTEPLPFTGSSCGWVPKLVAEARPPLKRGGEMSETKRKRKPKPKIRGWDWSELIDILGIAPVFNEACEHDQAEMIRLVLNQLISKTMIGLDKPDAKEQKQITGCRAFMAALGKCRHSYDAPVWTAISRIEDDYTMLSWLHRELERAWS